jgi:hypothetical protein
MHLQQYQTSKEGEVRTQRQQRFQVEGFELITDKATDDQKVAQNLSTSNSW